MRCIHRLLLTRMFQFDDIEQDVLEILHLIRSWRNAVVPISKIPPEILSLVPDFWDADGRDEDVIALTHVCRTWREVFTSRPSLWTYLKPYLMSKDKTRVYLDRSKSSPISLALHRHGTRSREAYSLDPRIIPQVIGRLRYLFIEGKAEHIQAITAHLSRPAPLLEDLSILNSSQHWHTKLASTLFNGDLSSLRKLHLDSVRTNLPWRNMVNLTSFTLTNTPPGRIPVIQLLDFFESAPHLSEIGLYSVTPTPGAQKGRLVSLTCLKRMEIDDSGPPSIFLDHLLIPVGAELVLDADLLDSLVGDFFPRSLDNLRNLSNFTTIKLAIDGLLPRMSFSGPNGRVSVTPTASPVDRTSSVLELLAQLDTSKTERLRIDYGNPLSRDVIFRALLPLKELRVLMLYRCDSTHIFFRALHPSSGSPVVVICPKLEELVLVHCGGGEVFDMKGVVRMAEVRASRGRKLKTLVIADWRSKSYPEDMSELRKYVGHVEYGPQAGELGGEW